MKKFNLLLLYLFVCAATFAQYSPLNSQMLKALVEYRSDMNGFYVKSTDVPLSKVDFDGIIYAYDKSTHNLYLQKDNGNYEITLGDEYAKAIKHNERIPKLKDEALATEIARVNSELDEKFKKLNAQRKAFLLDSTKRVRDDSIAAVEAEIRADSIKRVETKNRREEYRATHHWNWVPINGTELLCSDCDHEESPDSTKLCDCIINDTIYYWELVDGDLGLTYMKLHKYEIPEALREDSDFTYHLEAFRDSLEKDTFAVNNFSDLNPYMFGDYLTRLKKEAPYGYFNEWGWDDEYSMISFNFKYTNTNRKTIRYIDVYFVVTNDVGDVRGSGHFKGTGPLKEWSTASWDWDSSRYFVAGDASNMQLTKVIITYMDRTQKILNKSMIHISDSDDSDDDTTTDDVDI